MPASSRPVSIGLRSYQVGFGDCFLLSFRYDAAGTKQRHVLIDCGSTGRPKYAPTLEQVAKDIRARCGGEGGKLHVVVATHRHADHISGFSGKAGEILTALHPDVVLQPWTEDPDLAPDARGPTALKARGRPRAFTRALASMHEIAARSLVEIERMPARKTVRDQVRALGEVNLKNAEAVRTLSRTMTGRKVYAFHGKAPGLAQALPGVKVRVLGPPTLEQSEAILEQRREDPSEFWHLQARAAAVSERRVPDAFRGWRTVLPGALPFETRWFLPRLDAVHSEQLLEIVRILDEALNNTSLILLFGVGKTRLLFPGDAQIENWLYALEGAPDHKKGQKRLAGVHVYKVGHHGSLNATPKTLWRLFGKKGGPEAPERLRTFVSTMAGKHGSHARGTEVPRDKLIEALRQESAHFSTQELKKKADIAKDFEIPVLG